MDLLQLQAFYLAVQESSFSRAAEMLHITQPAISSRITKLEAELNVELFQRGGRHLALSKYGEMLMPYARKILALSTEARDKIERSRSSERSGLDIGTTSRIATYVLPSLLERFKRANPKVEITVQTSLSEHVLEMLVDGTINVGLTNTAMDNGRFAQLELLHDKVVLVSSPRHSLYLSYLQERRLVLDDLAATTIINFNRETTFYRPVFELLRQMHVQPRQTISVDNIEAMKRMAMCEMGAAFLPRMAVHAELEDGTLVEIPFPDHGLLLRQTFLTYERRRYMNPAIGKFVDVVQEWLAQAPPQG